MKGGFLRGGLFERKVSIVIRKGMLGVVERKIKLSEHKVVAYAVTYNQGFGFVRLKGKVMELLYVRLTAVHLLVGVLAHIADDCRIGIE